MITPVCETAYSNRVGMQSVGACFDVLLDDLCFNHPSLLSW